VGAVGVQVEDAVLVHADAAADFFDPAFLGPLLAA
jgi:hypothetical protein